MRPPLPLACGMRVAAVSMVGRLGNAASSQWESHCSTRPSSVLMYCMRCFDQRYQVVHQPLLSVAYLERTDR